VSRGDKPPAVNVVPHTVNADIGNAKVQEQCGCARLVDLHTRPRGPPKEFQRHLKGSKSVIQE
jgi:hypothetical protein